MLSSRSITVHLLRGAAGFAALGYAFVQQSAWSFVLVGLALLALRGCPTCWTIGLLETLRAERHGRGLADCRDGRCPRSANSP